MVFFWLIGSLLTSIVFYACALGHVTHPTWLGLMLYFALGAFGIAIDARTWDQR